MVSLVGWRLSEVNSLNNLAVWTIRWDFGGDAIIVSSTSGSSSPLVFILIFLIHIVILLSEHKQACPPDAGSSIRNGMAMVPYANTGRQLPDRGRIQGIINSFPFMSLPLMLT